MKENQIATGITITGEHTLRVHSLVIKLNKSVTLQ